ncbi:type 2 isopentenyl-diphosphate Delta-isomerase [Brevibacillus humidisoli]|uniref:type 2 isopentenyl-diphosphate Delta-isomerase n=1 Tax=Brevibacillus humidisoli TaxID=2895522 RepID=UPI001E4EA9BA|nr:type 2 isopentenyl-diphosphate Delta-isomerase [Brevibacillus humidisoli]UFJ42803.1 type 2 isopentenyl-diphosphate Delta-isomerase [Brevibacillus humidisoli]
MSRSKRKWEHIQHALSPEHAPLQGLDEAQFVPDSLPNISYVNTVLSANLQELKLSSPVIINAMTGGSPETKAVNQKLALIAREKKLAMAVGSQMAALRNAELADSYQIVRRENPDGIVFANLGAEASAEEAMRAVEMLCADGLQLHLNVMQELLMPEGNRDFSEYRRNIERIANQLLAKAPHVPLMVKEVGFGMSRKTMRQLYEAGVAIIDVGGAGGTNFARIENQRSEHPLVMFETWGLDTLQSLLEAGASQLDQLSFVATGGIRHGLDAAKALSLGASAVGMAGFFLRLVQHVSMEECLSRVDQLHHQLRVAMTALGAATLADLQKAPLTFSERITVWADQRGIDIRKYALRDVAGLL